MSDQLTEDQIQAIAQNYHDMADRIRKIIVSQAATLTDDEEDDLEQQQDICLAHSSEYIAKGLALQQAQLEADGQDIKDAIAEADQAIQNIRTADKVLQIVTAATQLGASILKADYDAVPGELQAVWSTVRINTKPDDDTNS